MNLLIIGGTVFLGRALVEVALHRGHTLTIFNRGRSAPGLFPDLERLYGDRDADLSALDGRQWDAVIDTCGYVPRVVRKSAGYLSGSIDHYTFISSLSVYADFSQPGLDENAAVGELADETVEEVNAETYGPLKALCERTLELTLPGKALVIRPGLIVGPHDPSDRFTYWIWRVAQGGQVLAPGRPERSIQFIDVRDLADWIIRAIENHLVGMYNASSPPGAVTMGALLDTAKEVSQSDAQFTWVGEDFLTTHDIGEWVEMPLWLPETEPDYSGFFAFESRKAIDAGLRFRPLSDTVKATLDWSLTRPAAHQWRAGITREREAGLLQDWAEASR